MDKVSEIKINNMVQFCCVVGCGNRSNREYRRFYRLPTVPKPLAEFSAKAELIRRRRRQWLNNIARVDLKDGDSSYSAGYIRVCSDHFFAGKPSELTDVENIDWAPTLKMGKSWMRLKGNNIKKEMFGFSASERRRNKKLTRWTETNSVIQTIIPASSKTESSEMEQRKLLAIETDIIDKKKYYKFKKNPWSNRRKSISNINKQNKISFIQRKEQKHANILARRKKKVAIQVKMNYLKKKREQAEETFKKKRSITLECLDDEQSSKSTECIKLYKPVIIPLVSSPSKSPLIHKITIECLDDDQSYKSTEFIKLYKPIITPLFSTPKSPLIHKITIDSGVDKELVPSSIKYDNTSNEKFHDNHFESELNVQPTDEYNVKTECDYDIQPENKCDISYNVCDFRFEDFVSVMVEEEFNKVKDECGVESEIDYDGKTSLPQQYIAPTAGEYEQILEMMNEDIHNVKEEIIEGECK